VSMTKSPDRVDGPEGATAQDRGGKLYCWGFKVSPAAAAGERGRPAMRRGISEVMPCKRSAKTAVNQ
jgi:hypothetical protein